MSSIATAIYAVNHVAEWDLYRRSSLGAHNDYMGKSLKKFIPLEVHHLLLHSIRNSSTMTLSLNIVYFGVYIHYTFNLSVNAEHNHRNICIYTYTYIFILGLSVRNRKRQMFFIYTSLDRRRDDDDQSSFVIEKIRRTRNDADVCENRDSLRVLFFSLLVRNT